MVNKEEWMEINMELNFVFLYVTTVFLASITPGPSMILALNHGIKYGTRPVLASAFGNLTATLIQASLSIAGLGLILKQSENIFNTVKYLGAIYLIYLGIKTFFSPIIIKLNADGSISTEVRFGKLFTEAFIVTMGNPKAIIFFTALFPQFIQTGFSNIIQLTMVLAILAVTAFCCMMIYGFCGGKMVLMLTRMKIYKWINRLLGGTLIGMGIGLATGRLS